MAFKKTYALIKGSWDGTPGSSNFTQDATVFATTAEFNADITPHAGMTALIDSYVASGDIVARAKELSADGKVKISTTEFIDEAAHDAFWADSVWDDESLTTDVYDVEEASVPEDINTFNEPGKIYYHSAAHVF